MALFCNVPYKLKTRDRLADPAQLLLKILFTLLSSCRAVKCNIDLASSNLGGNRSFKFWYSSVKCHIVQRVPKVSGFALHQ